MKLFKKGWKSIATVIVLVGLIGGPAYAAGLAKNSVHSKHIKDGEVKTADLADDAVTSAKILDSTITAADLGAVSVGNQELQINSVTSGEIADGSVHDNDLADVTVRTNSISVPAGEAKQVAASCNSGETALGGGSLWDGAATVGPVYIAMSAITGSSFTVVGRNDGGAARTLTAQVVCLA